MINLDRQFYLVITDHKSGAYVPEQNVWEMDRAKVIKDIREGQYDDVVAVIEFNPVEHTSRDATSDILSSVVAEWENESEGLSEWKIECIEKWTMEFA
jgi:hypothetical protein